MVRKHNLLQFALNRFHIPGLFKNLFWLVRSCSNFGLGNTLLFLIWSWPFPRCILLNCVFQRLLDLKVDITSKILWCNQFADDLSDDVLRKINKRLIPWVLFPIPPPPGQVWRGVKRMKVRGVSQVRPKGEKRKKIAPAALTEKIACGAERGGGGGGDEWRLTGNFGQSGRPGGGCLKGGGDRENNSTVFERVVEKIFMFRWLWSVLSHWSQRFWTFERIHCPFDPNQ